ncbi:helix-turn-helix domain-containing protein [Aliiglaciecola sp. CAU 1673]|uniref:helix-turn-helix domain-containing protein n=1 Tax=Aliiglaciecola sp. CAU 1673 TaxID=3032595 RepID=UPI0023DC0876|nr:helix-turn-helix domain-containing protein [Aliiglaciecola sp. CAU 1673]MDF2177976.1 helix-turn-helix domain-containing protein [Aliiglaciecola sp. CAU 1673]
MTDINPQLQLAGEIVQHTGLSLFLTGKAGTGKTTFLHRLKASCPKRMIVTAPTGVAAINAGGVTLHSFFQLPFGPYIPGSQLPSQHRFSKDKINILRSLQLLVIDEISMVRADMLDAVDAVLRRHRRNQLPFGGVQLLMIGDLHQLPPVLKEAEWSLLSNYYDNGYFFSSQALAQCQWRSLSLEQVYRQADPRFVDLLNKVRDSQLDEAALSLLNSRFFTGFKPAEGEDYVTLTTHNQRADAINQQQLAKLASPPKSFAAEVQGDYPEQNYPVDANLLLKVGAQVMFVRNDHSPEKRYFNGKTGVISAINGERLTVRCPGDTQDIEVEPVTWENIKYSLDKSNNIDEQIIGSFRQIPLRLAWAITIHKSQGLTFERAIIDGQAAFSHGQIYVALSRCTSLQGLVLQNPLHAETVKTDPIVSAFTHAQQPPDRNTLYQAKVHYQQKLLLEAFDYQPLSTCLYRLSRALKENQNQLHGNQLTQLDDLHQVLKREVLHIADKFQQQLQTLFHQQVEPQQDSHIQERVQKACPYFSDKLAPIFNWLSAFSFDTDNKTIRKQIENATDALRQELQVKQTVLTSCQKGFNTGTYLDAIGKAQISAATKKSVSKATSELSMDDLAHPMLYQQLKDWRMEQAKRLGIPAFQVLHQQVLLQIVNALPGSKDTLLQLYKVGPTTVEKYGDAILAVVADYCEANQLQPEDVLPESKQLAKAPKEDTKAITLRLHKEGLSIEQVAQQRGLATSTVEQHLAHFVEQGEVAIDELVSHEKQQAIRQALSQSEKTGLKPVKEALGDKVSWGDIRLVLASKKTNPP